MKVCKYCYSEIPKKATICPNCKKDLRGWIAKHPLLTLIIIAFLAFNMVQSMIEINNPSINPVNQIKQEEAPQVISAVDLYRVYKANEIRADDASKNKMLEISWKVDSIWKDILDHPFVSLETWDSIFVVQCMLKDSSKAADLKKWENIVVIWKNTWKLGNIIINDCYIK